MFRYVSIVLVDDCNIVVKHPSGTETFFNVILTVDVTFGKLLLLVAQFSLLIGVAVTPVGKFNGSTIHNLIV
jgi:hypothetical protein